MNQDDIYNLLLVLLLLGNERGDDQAANSAQSVRGSMNELIITSLLLNSCSTGSDRNDSCRCGRSGNTTF